jgi:GNAT superfamily N-acetyltransferase
MMHTDPASEVMLVVTTGAGAEEIVIGGGRFIASEASGPGRTAEVAFVVEEDYQGLGIASRILRHLAGIARDMGIVAFEADVLAENTSMLVVFERSGLPLSKRRDGGTVHATLSLAGGRE